MPFSHEPFAMFTSREARVAYRPTLWAAPPAGAMRPVADDAEHARPERRIDAVDTNRPDYDVVPEHDPDGTWCV